MGLPSSTCIDGFLSQRLNSVGYSLLLRQPNALIRRKTFRARREVEILARSISNLTQAPVHVGTNYEHLCLRVLCRLGFSLTRTGGKSDKGIDLLGTWEPPITTSASSSLLRVIVQCKAHAGQVQPALIRELEGAIAGAPREWRNDATIGVLCTPKGATGGIRDAMRMAERGIIWVTIEETLGVENVEAHAKVSQLLWNECVRGKVADGLGAGLRFVPGAKVMEQEVVLMLNGRVWQPETAAKI